MRLEVLKTFPWRIVYFVLAALLLLALAVFGSSGSTKQTQNNKEPISSKFQEENQDQKANLPQEETVTNKETTANSQTSTSTKVHVSVNTSTTNGETTGQASATVTQNGETQTITKDVSENSIRINIDGKNDLEIKNDDGVIKVNFDSDSHVRSRNKTSSDTDVDESDKVR